MRRRTPALLGVAVLTLTLAACSDDAPPEPGAASATGTAAATGADPTPAPEEGPLPLEEFWVSVDMIQDQENDAIEASRMEELISECMAREGFDYTPIDYTGSSGASWGPSDLDLDWTTFEFAQTYGYGITTSPPWNDEPDDAVTEDWVDPNAAYVEAMSEAEQEAYALAMWGDQSRFEAFTDADWQDHDWSWEDNGCTGWATHEVYGDAPGQGSQFDGLWRDMDAMHTAIDEDPRRAQAIAAWSACMADGGYPGLANIWAAQDLIYAKTDPIWDEVYEGVDLLADDVDYETFDRVVDERIAQFAEEEIAIAVLDWTCQDEVGLARIKDEVQREHEAQFVEDHRAELEAYAESMR